MRNAPFPLVLLLVSLLAGCAGDTRGQRAHHSTRDRAAAVELVKRGNEAFQAGDAKRAEAAYREALRADAFSGPAYNNLGRVLFEQRKLYAAAQAFDRAARLLPHHPEPRNNLGLVLESAGRFDDAIVEYDRALAQHPDNTELLANLARALVRRGDETREVRELLEHLTVEDDRPRWRQWARLALLRLDRHHAEGETATP